MKQDVQHRERLTKLGDISEVNMLYQKIQELDAKYGVDSKDQDNTFGIIDREKALVSFMYESNIYFFLNGYTGKTDALPKFQNVVIPVNCLITRKDRKGKEPLQMEETDKETLFRLREEAVAAIKKVYPKRPVFKETDTTRGDQIKRLEEQGFAAENVLFEETFFVNGYRFTVRYEWLDGNRHPYFSTSYKGWQNQEELPHESIYYLFYKKWNPFHTQPMTRAEYEEMRADVEELKEKR